MEIDEGTGSTSSDASGNAHTAILGGGPYTTLENRHQHPCSSRPDLGRTVGEMKKPDLTARPPTAAQYEVVEP